MNTTEVGEAAVENVLAHVGVKGMKWGVKRAVDKSIGTKTAGRRPVTKTAGFKRWSKISEANVQRHHARKAARTVKKKEAAKAKAKSDKVKATQKAAQKVEKAKKREKRRADWEKASKEYEAEKFKQTVNSPEFKARLHNDTVNVMNNYRIPQIDRKYAPYVLDGTLANHSSPVTKKYWDEVQTAYVEEANKHISTITDVTGTKHLTAVRRKSGMFDDPTEFAFDIQVEDIKHANDILYIVRAIRDPHGLVTGFEIVDDSMTQGTLFVDNTLTHYGKKGMKWGVRNRTSQAKAYAKKRTGKAGPQPVTVKERGFPRKSLKTKGGEGRPAHPEAVSAREIGQIGKASGLKSLSNAQLQEYNNRLNLEQNAKRLQYEDSSPPKKFVKTMLRQTGSKTTNDVSKKASKKVGKLLVTAAMA